jgi:hypothetical protein
MVGLTLLLFAESSCLGAGSIDPADGCSVSRTLPIGAVLLRDALGAVDASRIDDAIVLGEKARGLSLDLNSQIASLREGGMREDTLTTVASAARILDQMGLYFSAGPNGSNPSIDAARTAIDEIARIADALPMTFRHEYSINCEEDSSPPGAVLDGVGKRGDVWEDSGRRA